MGIKIYQVDAFTDKPFSGNPAAVCLLNGKEDEKWMQDIAFEMNLSETAFLSPRKEGYGLRWFTPTQEVDLCGHATLASAHVLWSEGYLSDDIIRFHTRSGLLIAKNNGELIELDFPSEIEKPASTPEFLTEALGFTPAYVGKNRFDYLIELDNAKQVIELDLDLGLLKRIQARGFIVTSLAESDDYDFISRFFAPGSGIDEDPVTGSAHCCLGPYWANRLGKSELVAFQSSKRGGVVHVRLNNDRVILGGKAVTVLRGELA